MSEYLVERREVRPVSFLLVISRNLVYDDVSGKIHVEATLICERVQYRTVQYRTYRDERYDV
jgi:hypothetical protein